MLSPVIFIIMLLLFLLLPHCGNRKAANVVWAGDGLGGRNLQIGQRVLATSSDSNKSVREPDLSLEFSKNRYWRFSLRRLCHSVHYTQLHTMSRVFSLMCHADSNHSPIVMLNYSQSFKDRSHCSEKSMKKLMLPKRGSYIE